MNSERRLGDLAWRLSMAAVLGLLVTIGVVGPFELKVAAGSASFLFSLKVMR